MKDPTILIVDDSPNNREVFSLLLEHIGYRVATAADGWDGVRRARELHPALILMDVAMPNMDGIEATELLKVDDATRDIPVIGISAHTDPLTISRAYAVGMAAYLTKPAPPRRVLQEIERCLRGSARLPPPPEPDTFRRPCEEAG